jgi:hypothetical protein
MIIYEIVVKQLVPDQELDHDDREEDVPGKYYFDGNTEDEALDKFHAEVPIACLDDFEIEAHQIFPELEEGAA